MLKNTGTKFDNHLQYKLLLLTSKLLIDKRGDSLWFIESLIMVRAEFDKKSKRLPLETKNTQKNENRRLGFIKSLHIQHFSLRGFVCPLAPA